MATEDASVDHGVALDALLAGLPIGAMSGEPTLEFRIADRPDVFVPPTLRAIDRAPEPAVTLLSARGATGKSVLARYISHEKRVPLWNLADDLSVSAHAVEAKLSGYLGPGRSSEFAGSPDAFVVIDALDEARFRVSGTSWTEFIRSLIAMSGSHHHFVMLGRERILEDVWLQLDEGGVACDWLEISHFGAEQRVHYVDSRVARKRDTTPDTYRNARDAVLEALAGTVDTASSDAFVGYAPVLDAVVALLQDGNLIAVENTFRDPELRGERLDVLVHVLERLLVREQKKVGPMASDLGIDPALAYQPPEQIEWLSAELFSAEQPALEWCPEDLRGDYAWQLAEFLRDHPFRAEMRWASPVFSAYIAARRFGDPLIRDHLIPVGRETELLFAFASTFDDSLTLDEWQFAALHASLLAAEWQAIEAYVSIDNADAEGEFDEAFGELVLLEDGAAQRRTPFELVVEVTGLLRLLGPMTALSVEVPGDVHVRPTGASLELGPDCYVRCRDLQLGGETIQVVRRATPTNGGGTLEDEASVVLEVSGAFRCDGALSANPPRTAVELRVRDDVRLSYPWVSYRSDYPERTGDPDERAVRFVNMFMNLVRNHGHRGLMAVFDKKLEGRQSVKGEELARTLGAMEELGVVRRSADMIFLTAEWEEHRFSGKGVQGLPSLAGKMDAWRPVLDAIGQVLD